MQPTNNSRPVMDVTARSRPSARSAATPAPERPAQPLPVHEPPASSEDTQPNPAPPAPTTATPASFHSDKPEPAASNHEPNKAPTPTPPGARPPVGIIVATVFAMLILSGAAIMIYSQS